MHPPRLGHLAMIATITLTGAIMAACGAPAKHDPAGSLTTAPAGTAVQGDRLWIQVPGGQVSVTVGDPEPTSDEDRDRIAVETHYDSGAGIPDWAAHFLLGDHVAPAVTLTVDGHRLPWGPSRPVSYITVDHGEEAPAVELQVTYAGVAQRVDRSGRRVTGAAGGLYHLADHPHEVGCDRGWAVTSAGGAVSASMRCQVEVGLLPYVAFHGWARGSRSWLAAYTYTSVAQTPGPKIGGAACVSAGAARATATLDGAHPTLDLNADEPGQAPTSADAVQDWVAFPVTPGTQHRLKLSFVSSCRGAARTTDLTSSLTLPVTA